MTTVLRIEVVDASAVRPLRSAVLRPGVPAEKLIYDGDESPGALHVAARDGAGDIHGIASLCREAAPGKAGVMAWRLRGMATTPAARGRGAGRRLLTACFDHVRSAGGGLLWCNARIVALGFYERLGLRREGEPFDIADIGMHYVMSRWLADCRIATLDDAAVVLATVAGEIVGYQIAGSPSPVILPSWGGRGIELELLDHERRRGDAGRVAATSLKLC